MIVTLQSIRKTKTTPRMREYTATFRIGGKIQRFHAVLRTQEGNAIRFREEKMDNLLAMNMDQGKKVYRAVFNAHRGERTKFPMSLGNLRTTFGTRKSLDKQFSGL